MFSNKFSERLSADECLRHVWLDGGGSSHSLPSSPQEPNNNEKQRNSNASPTSEGIFKILFHFELAFIGIILCYCNSFVVN